MLWPHTGVEFLLGELENLPCEKVSLVKVTTVLFPDSLVWRINWGCCPTALLLTQTDSGVEQQLLLPAYFPN